MPEAFEQFPVETLFESTAYFHPFPRAADVFANQIEEHARCLLPLATVDLSHLSPRGSGRVPFVMPLEPEDGVVGQDTAEFHTDFCRANWVGYRLLDGKLELDCDFQFFQPTKLSGHYNHVRDAFERRRRHFHTHGCLHHAWAEKDDRGRYKREDRVALAHLGGVSLDGNWSSTTDFPIAFEPFVDNKGEEWEMASPKTMDGRLFCYIGAVQMYHYIAESPNDVCLLGGDLLLFYDPKDQLVLTTFDWS